MAYSELIKDSSRIRDYMREFFVYGFKSRDEVGGKSARSYDNERRRIESWLGEYMSFRQDANGKNVFISVDSRRVPQNPLYQAWRAASFTKNDITLHFWLLDILSRDEALSLTDIMEVIDRDYLPMFQNSGPIDESTLRKKLKEYVGIGLVAAEKQGKQLVYKLPADRINLPSWQEAVAFFAEENPLGVIGSFLRDKFDEMPETISFKHNYLLFAPDSGILLDLLTAINERRRVELEQTAHSPCASFGDTDLSSCHGVQSPDSAYGSDGSEQSSQPSKPSVQRLKCAPRFNLEQVKIEQVKIEIVPNKRRAILPLKIFISTQGGRQYVAGCNTRTRRVMFFRLDSIQKVKLLDEVPEYDTYIKLLDDYRKHLWGVAASWDERLEHIEMTLQIEAGERHIVNRLEREKRCGQVSQVDDKRWRFTADVYDAGEMLPWIRTFTGRIASLTCTNKVVEERFYGDLAALCALYGGDNDVQ